MDIARILTVNYPDASWSLVGTNYDGLTWDGPGSKPTEAALTAAWPAVRDAQAWDRVRVERDRLLAASDWTQVADAPVDSAAWATYRQTLRDIPQDFATPDEVVWPTPPA